MKNTWRGIESCPFSEYMNGVWNVSVIKREKEKKRNNLERCL